MTFQAPVPILRIFDETKAKTFYVDYLGFTIDWEHRFEPNSPLYMQLSKSNCQIHLSEHHGDCSPGGAIRIELQELDAYLALLESKSYRFYNPSIVLQSWGLREMSVTDPFSNKLIFYANPNPNP